MPNDTIYSFDMPSALPKETTNVLWQRHRSHINYGFTVLPWPYTEYEVTLTSRPVSLPEGSFVRFGLPSFTDFEALVSELVYGVEDVPPGFSRAGNGAILVRIAHTEAWLEHLHLSLGALAVTVKGTHILGTRLEVKDLPRFRFEHIIGEAEPDQFDPKIRIAHIECPIPEKVTEKLWVVLSNGSGWLDESHSNATIHPLGPTLNNITSELSRSPTSSGNDIFEALGGSMLSGIDSQNANKNVFIVHGHDDLKKLEVARFVDELGLNSIILHEKPNHGRTILQKFEDYSDVGFAIALLTADDVGAPKEEQTALRLRARQNVIFELGYFLAKLKSHRVCALYEEGVEIPSDYIGEGRL